MVDFKLPNHIQEYLDTRGGSSEFIELFEGHSENIDLRTDLIDDEIKLINSILFNSKFLKTLGIENDLYLDFVSQYMRLKVSKDRQSRKEFVDVNKRERFDQNLDKFNSFQNLAKVKQ